ncbi:AAA family ATPase [Chloroflexota bacterium]
MAIITLSRGTYSGAKELAEYIARNNGYKLLSREKLLDELGQNGWGDKKLSRVRQKRLSITQSMNLEWIHYLACLRATLSEAARDEALVYYGDNGHLVLRGFPHILSIKVIANMEDRIKIIMARNEYAIDRKEAIKILNRLDERRERWSKFLYQTDANDVSSFDIVIDLSRKSIPDAYEMIHSTVSLPQFQPTSESKKSIEDLTLAAGLRAKIAMETDIIDDEIEVQIHEGMLIVKGAVHSREEANKLNKFLSSQPEVSSIESHLEESPQTANGV